MGRDPFVCERVCSVWTSPLPGETPRWTSNPPGTSRLFPARVLSCFGRRRLPGVSQSTRDDLRFRNRAVVAVDLRTSLCRESVISSTTRVVASMPSIKPRLLHGGTTKLFAIQSLADCILAPLSTNGTLLVSALGNRNGTHMEGPLRSLVGARRSTAP